MIDAPGLGTRLRRLILELDGAVQAAYDKAGIEFRPRFYPVVQWLQARGAAGIVELAQACGVSQPGMTQTVQEMRRAGLLVPVDSEDRRSRSIALSAKGRSVAAELERTWQAVERAARELDEELPNSLSGTVDAALAALADTSFASRIERHS
jgi:DNA-binding MarR family transcriptional regulator